MKMFVITISLFGALAICEAEENSGWEALRAHFNVGAPELDVPPTVHDAEFDGDSFTIQITNDSKEVMAYRGYFSDEPEFFTSELVDGAWEPRSTLWCGTGMKGHLFEPGDEVTFRFDRDLKKRRIFVIFRMSSNRASLVKLWDPGSSQEAGLETQKTAPVRDE